MREVQASEAKTHLPQLLTEVERGESIIITRHGRAIARIVPEASERQVAVQRVKEELNRFRRTMPKLSVEEIISGKHEGHKY